MSEVICLDDPDVVRVGDVRYWYDINLRIYAKGEDGKTLPGGPIFSKSFRKVTVVAVGRKYATVKPFGMEGQNFSQKIAPELLLTEDQMNDRIWLQAHRPKIAEMVRNADAQTLKRVAEIVGYSTESRAPS